MASDDAYEILLNGKPTEMIELPIEWILDDNPYGHRSRIAILDRLIAHMKSKGRVWFATHEQVATYVKGAGTSAP